MNIRLIGGPFDGLVWRFAAEPEHCELVAVQQGFYEFCRYTRQFHWRYLKEVELGEWHYCYTSLAQLSQQCLRHILDGVLTWEDSVEIYGKARLDEFQRCMERTADEPHI